MSMRALVPMTVLFSMISESKTSDISYRVSDLQFWTLFTKDSPRISLRNAKVPHNKS